jgi:hypothetical protein
LRKKFAINDMESLKKFVCVLSLSEQNNIPPTLSCGQVGSSRS